MVVPHEGQAIAQWVGAKEHAVDPPRFQPFGITGGDSAVPAAIAER